MRALLLNKIGIIDELKNNLIIENIPEPKTDDDDVLVKIKCSALNHRDLWIAKGMYAGIKTPIVLGSDCSGIIEEVGINVSDFSKGNEVIINPSLDWGDNESFQSKNYKILGLPDNGTLQEYISVNKSKVYLKPHHLDFKQASAIPLAGLTAYRALFIKGNLHKGENVLITGIGGGVSTFALLFAVNTGANVFVTSSDKNKIGKALGLGAKAGVNYKDENWSKELTSLSGNKINLIIDGAGGESIAKCLDVISPGGRIVNYGATLGAVNKFEMRKLFWKQVSLLGTTMGSDNDFKNMVKFIEKHKIIPIVDKVFEMNEITEAFMRMENGNQMGKIVIRMDKL